MAVQTIESRTVGTAGALAVGFLLLAAAGVWFILTQGWGLIFEITYLLVLVIALSLIVDRLFIR
ncbi:hypothetical protein [Natronorubrum texcoconense]|uniref:Uncharacterized protein n=1 Tax=Natronorubrum texcoconense TaxID=1095776 RepID=A0A1G9CWE1_9EURY|nr:hypothetical protein [Natronorubrum texcoconense]SDK55735.1 hypothetical protein SAMN04515672_3326 [Natronorubrum texcoconense]